MYKRQAHTDPAKLAAMKSLADKYLNDAAVDKAGLLDKDGVKAVFHLFESEESTASTKVQLDAVINHLIGIQILHAHFVEQDIPELASAKAHDLGWVA